MCASTAVVVSPNPRLAWWALMRWVSVSQPLGVVFLVGLLVGGQGWDVSLGVWAFILAVSMTVGTVNALVWRFWSGRVRYVLDHENLTAFRGHWRRASVPVARIDRIDFDQRPNVSGLAFTHWLDDSTPLPGLVVHRNVTSDRWDVTNDTEVFFPAILLAGDDQDRALQALRERLEQHRTE